MKIKRRRITDDNEVDLAALNETIYMPYEFVKISDADRDRIEQYVFSHLNVSRNPWTQ